MRRIGWLVAFFWPPHGRAGADLSDKPIRAIVPFPAGSATDGMARLVSAHFTKVFGHGLIIENMVGATGSIASRATAKAAPDGYTIMFSTNSTHSANAYLYNNLGYDPIADFTPLALLSRAPHAMVVRADAPYPASRISSPSRRPIPTSSIRLRQHRQPCRRRDAQRVRRDQDHAVSYRGTPQVTTDLLGGQIEFVVMDVSQTQEHIKAGKLRTLAVTGLTRMENFPNADHDRARLSGFRALFVERRARARGDAARYRRDAEQGDPRRDQHAGGQALL